jgi:hypothetical protein
MSHRREYLRVDFDRVAREAAQNSLSILQHWLNGKRLGREFIALNPRRADSKPGSFKVNINTGAWSDFATNDRGRDLISLAAYLFDLDQRTAAIRVAEMLSVDPYE